MCLELNPPAISTLNYPTKIVVALSAIKKLICKSINSRK